jgi:hypothetical protein
MFARICAFIGLIALPVGCVHVRVYHPFKDVNTMLVDARAPKMMLASAKAILIAHMRSVEEADGTTVPTEPKLIVVDYCDLRGVRFVDERKKAGKYARGSMHSREAILVYKPGFEPAWLERRFYGKDYRYPVTLALRPCDPVRARRLVFDAVAKAFAGETESCRQAALRKIANYVK